jgi:hypothetical protein
VRRYGTLTRCGGPSQTLPLPVSRLLQTPSTPLSPGERFGLLGVRSPLLTEYLSFPRATEMFQFTRFPLPCRSDCLSQQPGFPIRTSSALSPAHGSPTLFAVYHVLLRHGRARHPPYALRLLVACDTEKLTLSRYFVCCIHLLSCAPELIPRPPPSNPSGCCALALATTPDKNSPYTGLLTSSRFRRYTPIALFGWYDLNT